MPPPCFAVGSGGSSLTSGDVVAADGAAVDPTVVTWSPSVLQAAVTATRHSAAMNRAGPRGVRPARRNVGSGSMQEAAARNHHASHHRPTSGQHQTEGPGGRTFA